MEGTPGATIPCAARLATRPVEGLTLKRVTPATRRSASPRRTIAEMVQEEMTTIRTMMPEEDQREERREEGKEKEKVKLWSTRPTTSGPEIMKGGEIGSGQERRGP